VLASERQGSQQDYGPYLGYVGKYCTHDHTIRVAYGSSLSYLPRSIKRIIRRKKTVRPLVAPPRGRLQGRLKPYPSHLLPRSPAAAAAGRCPAAPAGGGGLLSTRRRSSPGGAGGLAAVLSGGSSSEARLLGGRQWRRRLSSGWWGGIVAAPERRGGAEVTARTCWPRSGLYGAHLGMGGPACFPSPTSPGVGRGGVVRCRRVRRR
jgi:hypothetical protein